MFRFVRCGYQMRAGLVVPVSMAPNNIENDHPRPGIARHEDELLPSAANLLCKAEKAPSDPSSQVGIITFALEAHPHPALGQLLPLHSASLGILIVDYADIQLVSVP